MAVAETSIAAYVANDGFELSSAEVISVVQQLGSVTSDEVNDHFEKLNPLHDKDAYSVRRQSIIGRLSELAKNGELLDDEKRKMGTYLHKVYRINTGKKVKRKTSGQLKDEEIEELKALASELREQNETLITMKQRVVDENTELKEEVRRLRQEVEILRNGDKEAFFASFTHE